MLTAFNPKFIIATIPNYVLVAMLVVAVALLVLVGPEVAEAGRRSWR